MKAYYDNKPSKFEAVGNGSVLYRYNITEETAPVQQEGETPRTQWVCEEVVVWEQVTKNGVVAAVINDRWTANHEQKLVNEYNSVKLGVISGDEAAAVEEAYKEFLAERRTLKAAVEADCDEAGIA
jgi:hypothetical protein